MSLRRPKMQIKPKVLSTSSTRSSPNSNGIKSDSTQSQESSKSSSTQSQSLQLSQSSDNCDSSQTLSQNKSFTTNSTNETIITINDEQSVDSSLMPVVTQKRKRPIPRVTDFLALEHIKRKESLINSQTSSETPVKESQSLQKDSEIISTNNERNGNKKVHNESCNLLTTKLYPVIEDSDETEIEDNITENNSEVITSEKLDDLSIESEANKSKPVSNQSNEVIDENVANEAIVANDKNLESDKQKDNELKSTSISKLSKIKKRKAPKTRSQTDKTKMTMRDLLQYNPPLTEEQKEQRKYDSESEKSGNEITNTTDKESKQSEDQINVKASENSSGPRVKVGADGELILDEESVIVKRKKNSLDEPPVIETAKTTSACTNYSSFRTRAKTCHKPRWNEHETVRFYSALSLIGTDFTLMAQLFFKGKRTRLDLRNKFKKEEKCNRLMIDEALSSRNSFINQCEELKDLMNCDTSSDESDKETDDKSVSIAKSVSKDEVKI